MKSVMFAAVLILVGSSGALLAGEECVGFLEQILDQGGVSGVQSVFAVDLDGDGDLDVLAASLDDKVTWWENDGADPPLFTEHVISADADGAASVHATDMDGDGDIDVLSASSLDDKVSWYENSGTTPMAFFERTITLGADAAISVSAADVDGDGDMDALHAGFIENVISWHENLLNEVDPEDPTTFVERPVTGNAIGASSVDAGDLDGDGDVDMLSASVIDDKVAWYEQTGRDPNNNLILWTERLISQDADGAKSVSTVDLDGDGDLDVVSTSVNDGKLAWYENVSNDNPDPGDPDPSPILFTEHVVAVGLIGAKSAHVADVDGAGGLDIVLAVEQAGVVAWYESDGATPPTFTAHEISAQVESVDSVLAADINGDGDLDVLFGSSVPGTPSVGGEIAWFDSDGAAAPSFDKIQVEPSTIGADAAFSIDLDNDTDPDLLYAGPRELTWRENNGGEPPTYPTQVIATRPAGFDAVHAADVDGDGHVDVIAAATTADAVAWYRNDQATPPTFIEQTVTGGADSVDDLFAADVDGDLDMDILSASSLEDKIVWYENDGAMVPTFTEHTFEALGASAVFAADLSGNGELDILAGAESESKVLWLENDGADPLPAFTEQIIASGVEDDGAEFDARGVQDLYAADIDGDGDQDIVVAAAGDNKVAWYQNDPDPDLPGQRLFTETILTLAAERAISVYAADLDADGDLDLLSGSFADSELAWYENDGATPPTLTPHFVAHSPQLLTSVFAADLDQDTRVDILVSYQIDVTWYRQLDEICAAFDATGDELIDGAELAWLVRAFGRQVADGGMDWWTPLDFNQDRVIDGIDLAILSITGVWGESTTSCSFSCR